MKKLLLVAVLAGLSFAAVGCGPPTGTGTGPAKPTTPGGAGAPPTTKPA